MAGWHASACIRVRVPDQSLRQSRTHLLSLLFNMFINIPCRTSDCVERMVVDPVRAVVQVAFAKGNIYEYTHVSRRAILNLLMNRNISLGLWVNDVLLPYDCKSQAFGECRVLPAIFASAMPITPAFTA
tara:strand:- start:60 stop:446 length:387 start_codon:yes stop_codon:yes gene_type:complete